MNKPAALLILTLFSATTTGCMTSAVVEKISPSETALNPKTKKYEKPRAKPGYILLVPPAFAGDVVTAPLWIPFTLLFSGICG